MPEGNRDILNDIRCIPYSPRTTSGHSLPWSGPARTSMSATSLRKHLLLLMVM